jgi:hypothetical protein
MATDDIADRNDDADFLSAFGSADARNGWSTVPAHLFEAEPAAGGMRAAFLELYRRGTPEQIVDALEGIWLMLERAALWVSSIHADLDASSAGVIDQTCAALVPAIPRRIHAITCLGRASLDHLPTAMAAARAIFEAGLRLTWINAPQDPKERAIRVLLIHNSQAKWKRKVAADYDSADVGGDRWRQAAEVQENLVSRALDAIGSPELPRKVPSVTEQLHELNLDRLYTGYRLASEYVHEGLSSALDSEAIQTERSPFGIYWPNDWYLPVNMCGWGCFFLGPLARSRGFDLGPARGAMLASELMFLSPSSGWRQNGYSPRVARPQVPISRARHAPPSSSGNSAKSSHGLFGAVPPDNETLQARLNTHVGRIGFQDRAGAYRRLGAVGVESKVGCCGERDIQLCAACC